MGRYPVKHVLNASAVGTTLCGEAANGGDLAEEEARALTLLERRERIGCVRCRIGLLVKEAACSAR